MKSEVQEFHDVVFQDVLAAADAEGRYSEDAFFDWYCEKLVDAGELDTADRAPYSSPRGLRVDGYGGDPKVADGVLTLIVADFNQDEEVATLTATDMNAIFKRTLNFLSRAREWTFRASLDEAAPAFGLADLIAQRWPEIEKVRIILISNRVLSGRVDGRKAGELDGVPVVFSVWDLGRLFRVVSSGKGREEIVIDLEEYGESLPVLPAHLDDASYEAYLVVMPGDQLAAIYDRWGARLLEQNVRVFLQARGTVNRGIRATIENSPEMFFAFNNGITATAVAVETRGSGSNLRLKKLHNLQIVNGGQTTASIHAASRKKGVDLSRVFVQMKLSVIEPAQAEEIVPKISEFANSQNRINAADFFSNHPFHVRMQEFSRRLFAPAPDGSFRESKWFYERARGQYQDERGRLSGVQAKRRFELEYPRKQVFTKTDLAKYLNVWRGKPDVVSRGAQKNFAEFAQYIGKEWEREPDKFNEAFFRTAIAKAIIFREVERLVTKQPWYEGGYRANIVAYAIAKLSHDLEQMGRSVDYERIWRKQGISKNLQDALTLSAGEVQRIIVDPSSGSGNITEWAKQPACWTRVSALRIEWPQAWLDELLSAEERRTAERDGIKNQRILNGIEAQTIVVNAGAETWRSVREWGSSRQLLSAKEEGILAVAAAIPHRIPSEKQSMSVITTLQRLHQEGCQVGRDLVHSPSTRKL